MFRLRLIGVVALSVTATVPAVAGAAQRGAGVPRATAPALLAAAAVVGERHWKAAPCQGHVELRAQRSPTGGVDPTADAWATFDTAQGANDLGAPPSSYTHCSVSFSRERWPTAASMREDWDLMCTTMTHELGHLLGLAHDSTPGSVMAPMFTDRSSLLGACRATRPARSAQPRHR